MITVELPKSTLNVPRSNYEGFAAPAAELEEEEAVNLLQKLLPDQEDFVELDLDEFTIYGTSEDKNYPGELRPLQHLAIKVSSDTFCFDGVLKVGGASYYIRKVPFRELPIGNYGSQHHTVGDQIWIRSRLNETREIYYKLGNPAGEYSRFFTPFRWIVDLAKHTIDYLRHLQDNDQKASIHDFKSNFSTWLLSKHRDSLSFMHWFKQHGSYDFGADIVANADFLWKEACGQDVEAFQNHTLWKEILFFDHIPTSFGSYEPGQMEDTQRQIAATNVTQYAKNMFGHFDFGNFLNVVAIHPEVKARQQLWIAKSSPQHEFSLRSEKRTYKSQVDLISVIQVGDVISTSPDSEDSGTKWRREPSEHHDGDERWYGIVQKIHESTNGPLNYEFDVIWLYKPGDTPCALMKYPWLNELFLSTSCTCQGPSRIRGDEVLSLHEVDWFGSPQTSSEFFVRQTYLTNKSERRWASLKPSDLRCDHAKAEYNPYKEHRLGDTVLVKMTTTQLEPFEVDCFFRKGKKWWARLRRLWRRKQVDPSSPNSADNELVYSSQFVNFKCKRIVRQCLVRKFSVGERIPAPYDRNGTGDAFFITHREIKTSQGKRYIPASSSSVKTMRQGFDLRLSRNKEKLAGLEIFGGGGSFGRGLEEGGAVEIRWVNDNSEKAIHTYMANTEPGVCRPYLGSIDDFFKRLASCSDVTQFPQPGEVGMISGGPPCPGYSLITVDKTTAAQQKNRSYIASFVSFVDHYRPLYGLMENVPGIIQTKQNRHKCVFSQLICALVGLGYQTQILYLNACSFGAPQHRSRIFLCFAAPGQTMPKPPAASHSTPGDLPVTTVGQMSNGEPYGEHEHVATVFKYASAKAATQDLPDIGDAKADYCVGFPDHRLTTGYTRKLRKQISLIPTQPYGMSFSKVRFGYKDSDGVFHAPILTPSDRRWFTDGISRTKPNSKGWGRIRPDDLFNTVTTTCDPTDSRLGRSVHWKQPRQMTIMEARRAQGFPDHEVLLGGPRDQWAIVGNSVARQVALVLGLSIREAWFGTLHEDSPEAARNDMTIQQDTVVRSVEIDGSDNFVLLDSRSTCSSLATRPNRATNSRGATGLINPRKRASNSCTVEARAKRLCTNGVGDEILPTI